MYEKDGAINGAIEKRKDGIVAWMELDSKIQDNAKLATLVMSVS